MSRSCDWITVDEQMDAAAGEAARRGPRALETLCREAWLAGVRGPGFASESVEWCLDLIDWNELAAALTEGGKR